MADRETRNVQIGSHTVALRTYLTAREGNALRKSVYQKFSYKAGEDGRMTPSMNVDGTYILDQELDAFQLVIAAIDGSADDVKNRVQDLFTTVEYQELKAEVDKVTKSLFLAQKPAA